MSCLRVWQISMRQEADQLLSTSFGETMLHTIGRVYIGQADIALGGVFGGIAAKFRATGETMK